jgi:pyridoxamine 5'-phosphate oxidase
VAEQPVPPAIADIRRDYRLRELDEQTAGDDPIGLFRQWFGEALEAGIDEVNAMTLATAGADGRPHARIVLLKGLEPEGFVFFTNYESAKGSQIASTGHAALLFFWKELERQVRIEGRVEKIREEDSDAYYLTRPAGSRLGAWASPQSAPIESRAVLEQRLADAAGAYPDGAPPRPPFWGGYIVIPDSIEFWQGRSNRLHDRILFTAGGEGWQRSRLAP